VRCGKTPVLDPAETRQLIDAIDTTTVIGVRDRALIGLMVYSFARIGAAIGMRVEDVYTQNRRLWLRLQEKGGKQHATPFITSNPTESQAALALQQRVKERSGYCVRYPSKV
jgi:integrase